ncbi:Cellulose synthase regulatory subunit [Variovorax sp. PBS-H4]|uniref:cellulose biosynthesis cyclic di-GMP-binding regulatory protein BcsB n=1 Tax=Variovorax sp. PBS-H4 TaxID=434008 RepID=UPI0013174DBB|nr:cellulose biosynthesis cyclic di-GMP-binding regulatory protein BcsB [Variovorax sp. PBS-H4]VTU33911.1 Cellulose synthase regulatory subunit [Variovorax sp. PBS-H4]
MLVRKTLLAFLLASIAWSAAHGQPAPAPAAPEATREMNLRQLGVDYAITLRGTHATVGIPFSVRGDELVTAASLRLDYAYSPALLPELSHLAVSVNDVLVATLPATREGAGQPRSTTVPIDRRLIGDHNRINLEFIGHYTRECEDPAHSSLWAKVDASSTLHLTVEPFPAQADLGTLPAPFFDPRDVRRLRLPFVLGDAGFPTLEAAGIVSSWFGALAGYRGAVFPVTTGTLPQGSHAVVFAMPGAALEGLQLPAIEGPALAVVDRPGDPLHKLLLVMGRTPTELRTAAAALALNSRALTGGTTMVDSFEPPPARRPYDAPRWIAGDRPVQLGELAAAKDLSVAGYTPDVVKVNLQLPPDLFTWRTRGIPLVLGYRYTPRARPDQSTLNISLGDSFVGSLPLRAANPATQPWWNPFARTLLPDGTSGERKTILLPPLALGARSQLRLHYNFQPDAAPCKPLLDNVRGSIDADSTLDISGLPHYIAMPELAAFANGGFPFTRLADLADTAVLMPDAPVQADQEIFLALMGQLGNATGYPALRATVGGASKAAQWADKDLLVLGSLQRQPLFAQWADRMPLARAGAVQDFRLGTWFDEALRFVTGTRRREDLPPATQMAVSADGRDAALAGFESPLKPGRSVVAVIAGAEAQPALLEALMAPEMLRRIQGSTSIVHGTEIHSLLAGESYYVGRLPPVEWVQWKLSRNPLLLAGMILAVALMGAGAAYFSLQRRARRRLRRGPRP